MIAFAGTVFDVNTSPFAAAAAATAAAQEVHDFAPLPAQDLPPPSSDDFSPPSHSVASNEAAAPKMEYREAMLKRTVAVIRSCRLPPDQAFEVRLVRVISFRQQQI